MSDGMFHLPVIPDLIEQLAYCLVIWSMRNRLVVWNLLPPTWIVTTCLEMYVACCLSFLKRLTLNTTNLSKGQFVYRFSSHIYRFFTGKSGSTDGHHVPHVLACPWCLQHREASDLRLRICHLTYQCENPNEGRIFFVSIVVIFVIIVVVVVVFRKDR